MKPVLKCGFVESSNEFIRCFLTFLKQRIPKNPKNFVYVMAQINNLKSFQSSFAFGTLKLLPMLGVLLETSNSYSFRWPILECKGFILLCRVTIAFIQTKSKFINVIQKVNAALFLQEKTSRSTSYVWF